MADDASAWHLGSRVKRVRASHSYGIVLLVIFASFFFAAVAPNTNWAESVLVLLQSATLVLSLWTAGVARADSIVSVTLIALSVAGAVALVLVGGSVLEGAVGSLSGLLVLATMATIALGVIDQHEANAKAVMGAICFYVLIGMLFVFIYGVIAALGSGPLFSQGTDATRPIRLYFSFVTLATLGYGDYTPAGDFGRLLAVTEALTGQLYLVTVIAVLVSRLRPAR